MRISLKGLDKAQVLAALYNASKPQGMGFLQYDPEPMDVEEAERCLNAGPYFDYLKGRVMKVDLSGEDLNPRNYDCDNGIGAAEKAISAVRNQQINSQEIQEAHATGKLEAAAAVKANLDRETVTTKDGGVAIIQMGLADVADKLGPAVDKAID